MQLQNPRNAEEMEQLKRLEQLKRDMLAKYLTKEARERLGNIRYAHPDLTESVENLIVQSALANKLREPIDDKKLKELLHAISESQPSNENRIKFDRKL